MSLKKLSKQQKQQLNNEIVNMFTPMRAVVDINYNIAQHRISEEMYQHTRRSYKKRNRTMTEEQLIKLAVVGAIVAGIDIILLTLAVFIR